MHLEKEGDVVRALAHDPALTAGKRPEQYGYAVPYRGRWLVRLRGATELVDDELAARGVLRTAPK